MSKRMVAVMEGRLKTRSCKREKLRRQSRGRRQLGGVLTAVDSSSTGSAARAELFRQWTDGKGCWDQMAGELWRWDSSWEQQQARVVRPVRTVGDYANNVTGARPCR